MASSSSQQPPDESVEHKAQPFVEAAAKTVLNNLNARNIALSLEGASDVAANEKAEQEMAAALKPALATLIQEYTQNAQKELGEKDAAIKALGNQKQPLKTQIEELRRILGEKNEDLKELRGQVKDYDEAKETVQGYQDEIQLLKKVIQDYESKEVAKRTEYEDAEAGRSRDRGRWETDQRKLKTDLQRAEDELTNKTEEVDKLNKSLEEAMNDNKMVEDLNEEYGKKLGENSKKIPQLENQVKSLEAAMEALKVAHEGDLKAAGKREADEELQRQFAAFRDQAAVEQQQMTHKFQIELKNLEDQVKSLKDPFGGGGNSTNTPAGGSLADEIGDGDRSETSAASESRVKELESQIEQLMQERDAAVKASDEAHEAIRESGERQKELERLRNEKNKLESTADEFQDYITDLESAKSTNENDLNNQISRLQAELTKSYDDKAALTRDKKSLQHSRDTLQNVINELEMTISTNKDDSTSQIERLEAEIGKLSDERADLGAELDNANMKVARIGILNRSLEKRLDDLQQQIQHHSSPETSPSKSETGKSNATAYTASAASTSASSVARGSVARTQATQQIAQIDRTAGDTELTELKERYKTLNQLYAVDLRMQDDFMRVATREELAALVKVPLTRPQWEARYEHAGETLRNVKADLRKLESDDNRPAILDIAKRDIRQAAGAVKNLQDIIHNIVAYQTLASMMPEFAPGERDPRTGEFIKRDYPPWLAPRIDRPGVSGRLSPPPFDLRSGPQAPLPGAPPPPAPPADRVSSVATPANNLRPTLLRTALDRIQPDWRSALPRAAQTAAQIVARLARLPGGPPLNPPANTPQSARPPPPAVRPLVYGGRGGSDPPPGPDTESSTDERLTMCFHLILLLALLALLVFASASVAEGRRYAVWRQANDVTRAVYISDWYYLSLPLPHMVFFWELFRLR